MTEVIQKLKSGQSSRWERYHGSYFVGQYLILDAWNGPQIKRILAEGRIIHNTFY